MGYWGDRLGRKAPNEVFLTTHVGPEDLTSTASGETSDEEPATTNRYSTRLKLASEELYFDQGSSRLPQQALLPESPACRGKGNDEVEVLSSVEPCQSTIFSIVPSIESKVK